MTAPLELLREEADWVLAARLRTGPICSHLDLRRVDPYLGAFAALGLTSAGALLRDPDLSSAAYSHLVWHASSGTPEGFVTDFDVVDGTPVSTGDMDSTDGYAGMFLVATRSLVAHTGLRFLPGRFLHGTLDAVRAIRATQDSDGLTWAKPAWRVKYLMDQVEAAAGLEAALDLSELLREPSLADAAAESLPPLLVGLESLWDPRTDSYVWAVHEDGSRVGLDRSEFYPGSVSQLWPVAFGLVDGVRGKRLVERFLSDHPDWAVPNRPVPGKLEYWPVVCWALGRVGASVEAREGALSILEYARSRKRAWPYNPGTAGQLLTFLSGADVTPLSRRLRRP